MAETQLRGACLGPSVPCSTSTHSLRKGMFLGLPALALGGPAGPVASYALPKEAGPSRRPGSQQICWLPPGRLGPRTGGLVAPSPHLDGPLKLWLSQEAKKQTGRFQTPNILPLMVEGEDKQTRAMWAPEVAK
jgi:hypothetical protein